MLGVMAPTVATEPVPAHVQIGTQGVTFRLGDERLSIQLDGADVVHVKAVPDARTDEPTLVMDPARQPRVVADVDVHEDDNAFVLASDRLVVVWHKRTGKLSVGKVGQRALLTLDLAALAQGRVDLAHAAGQSLYGIGGYTIHQSVDDGLLRSGKRVAEAGEQGHAGAPFVWSTAGYGVLVDSNGAAFDLGAKRIQVSGLSKLAVDVYLMVGDPPRLFAELARLSGHAPMFPKWSLGFINSQWGIDEKELLDIVATYRRKHIPIDGFILDFDWKAWGKDNYGEFRWNPEKFPDGPSGRLQAMLGRDGIHLGGIMKPRIHVDTVEGRYATIHKLWLPGERVSLDYFSHKPVKEIDFDKPEARQWFGANAIKYGFDKGIVGWWNDEADTTLGNTQFLNMERALYTAQRAASDTRVWSINRNFWLGAQRYAYGLWSGDIDTGFAAMARQRTRMLSAIGVGEMWWGMDGGGFDGHPSDENYARWIEFGAFTPIFRVHGTFGEKRQPWVYGPVAEKAAAHAIRLRYKLLPYVYSYAHHASVAGVGLVRPLTFDWPHDPNVRNDVDAWMFGRWLLVSPVVKQGAVTKDIYLPAGTWTRWSTGKVYRGGQTITIPVDSRTWSDIPLFIRAGAIIPTQPVLDYTGERPIHVVAVDVFPSTHETGFTYYDDDGDTYAYTHGAYFSQRLSVRRMDDGSVRFVSAARAGMYRPALKFYLLKVHGIAATNVSCNGDALPQSGKLQALEQASGSGWARGHDRYGDTTYVRLPAGIACSLVLATANN